MADTQAIKDRIDIVQLLGEYLQLKKAGSNWKANCPFHNEKSPSFMVQAEKQIWHCFGCGKGGDIFSFVQEMEGMDFPEALKLLAQRAGITLDTYKSDGAASQRSRLLEITTAAAYFFHRFLLDIDAAEPARAYLKQRQLNQQSLLDWQIGFAPEQWDLLTKYLLKKGYGIDDLVAAGLTIKREGADAHSGKGYYDRFRGRVMFPISDIHGNVVGFTGRVLVETEKSGGKYVNTPQTMLYDKSRVLYGIHKAKTEIKTKGVAVLVEGQMDVIACHQAGMKNVVAASGTALTAEQIKLLKRYTTNFTMAFDADAAGQSAGKRGIALAIEEGFRVKVIQLPAGFAKDADECLKKDPAVWFKAVEEARSVLEWYFSITLSKLDKRDAVKKQEAAGVLLEEISHVPYAVERDDWLKRLSDELGIDLDILREEIKKVKKAPVAAKGQEIKAPVFKIALPASQLEALAQELWSLLLKYPEHYSALAAPLNVSYFPQEPYRSLYEKANILYTTNQRLDTAVLRQQFHSETTENIVDVLSLRPYKNFTEMTAGQARQEMLSIISRLSEEWRHQRRKEIQHELSLAEHSGDKNLVHELLTKLQTI